MMSWSMLRAMCWVSRSRSSHFLLAALLSLSIGAGTLQAQNNTGYPSGTNCADLIEPRRSACKDAFDPRPNPRETINQPKTKALMPPRPRSLGQGVTPTNPKVPHAVPPPILRGQHK